MYFFAHRLAQGDYGRYQAFWSQLNIFNAIGGAGIGLVIYSYAPEQLITLLKNVRKRHFAGYFLFLVICGLVFGLLQHRNAVMLTVSALFLCLFALSNIADAFLIMLRRLKILVMINLLYAFLFFLVHFLFLYRFFDLNLLLWSLLPLLLLKPVCSLLAANIPAVRSLFRAPAGNTSAGNMFSFWRHMYFYDIIQVAFLWLDKFIISLLFSSTQTAVYVNGTLNIPFLPILFTAISGGALLHLTTDDSRQAQLATVRNVGRLLSSVAFPLCIFLLFFSKEFIIFFFSDKYLASVPVFVCSLLILPVRAYGHTIILQRHEKGRIINRGALMDIALAVALMYPMYVWIGLPGVALSFVVSTFLQVIYYFLQTRKLLHAGIYDLLPVANWVKKAVGFGLLGLLLYYSLPLYFSPVWRLVIGGGIIGVSSLCVLGYEIRKQKVAA